MKFLVNVGEVIVIKIVRNFFKFLSFYGLLIKVIYLVFGMCEICLGIIWFNSFFLELLFDEDKFVEFG